MRETDRQSGAGYELSSKQWLKIHHRTKFLDRRRMVLDLPLSPGQKVLDIGCGPGLWSWLLAEQIQPEGLVLGLDIDPELLEEAPTNRPAHLPGSTATFEKGDLKNLKYPDEEFDLTFFSNGFVYFRNPKRILEEQIRVTRKGGFVVGRHFDNTCFLIHPAPVELLTEISAKAALANNSDRTEGQHFDNSFGQKMHGLFSESGLQEVQTQTYAVQLAAPITEDAKTYIAETARWQCRLARPLISDELEREWLRYFDRSSSACILDLPSLYFCCLEMQTWGVK